MTDGSDEGREALAQIILRLGTELGHPLHHSRAEKLAQAIWPQFKAAVAEAQGQLLEDEAADTRHWQEAENGSNGRESSLVQPLPRRVETAARTATRFGADRSVGQAVRGAIDRLRGPRDPRGAGEAAVGRRPNDRFEFTFQEKRVGVYRLDRDVVSTGDVAGEATVGFGRWFYTVDGREYAGPKATDPVNQLELEGAIRADLERLAEAGGGMSAPS